MAIGGMRNLVADSGIHDGGVEQETARLFVDAPADLRQWLIRRAEAAA